MPETPAVDMDKLERELRDDHPYDPPKKWLTSSGAPRLMQEAAKTAHGDWGEQSMAAHALKDQFRSWPNWQRMDPMLREALDAMAYRLAGVLVGEPRYAKHWQAIAKFANLVADRL